VEKRGSDITPLRIVVSGSQWVAGKLFSRNSAGVSASSNCTGAGPPLVGKSCPIASIVLAGIAQGTAKKHVLTLKDSSRNFPLKLFQCASISHGLPGIPLRKTQLRHNETTYLRRRASKAHASTALPLKFWTVINLILPAPCL